MTKNKLQRFEENLSFPNLFQPRYEDLLKNPFSLKSNWRTDYFKNDHPIVLELACGKGEYTVGLAKRHPDVNFIGIDRQGARVWRGCKISNDENLTNVAFLRTQIQYIDLLFAKDEVDEIWITFPDPQPKKSKKTKRLTSQNMLERYAKVLKPEGIMHLKTDSIFFADFTLEVIEENKHTLQFCTRDLYQEYPDIEVAGIQTFYEQMWLSQGLKIHYLKFQLHSSMFK
ncbi:MAG: tRNA (guanosine(46)-N7)-methyltransferase TrmB [Bacteroidales bacterium]|nr:tRNA (guanosine(46)-N7)-methyltransferase TrmB [Bacteroidales bacterium]